jgi:signal transduction histidine kinase
MTDQRRSIATILAISVVVTSTTVLLAFAGVSAWQSYQGARLRLQRDSERTVAQLAIALQSPAWNFDRAQLEGLIDSAMQDADVAAVSVELSGAGGSVYARARDASWHSVTVARVPPHPTGLLEARRTIQIAAPARSAAAGPALITLGEVRVYTTLRFIRQQLRGTLLTTLVAILVSDLVLVATLYLVIRAVALNPLRRLRAHAAAVAAGADEIAGLDDRRFRGEFEQLRQSLAAMLGLLRSRYLALGQEQARYRQLMSGMLRVQDAERRRIGRELHDSTGQSLAALEINLALLQRAGTLSDPESRRLLDESEALARECVAAIRTTSYLLHPPLLDELGLATALRWLADGFRVRSDIQLHVAVPEGGARLSAEAELALFRVAQEALTNVHRHSEARSAEIRLSRDAEHVTLCVSDTGQGFRAADGGAPPATADGNPQFGVGLTGMRERLRELGGELRICSAGSGTTVTAVLPADPDAGRPEATR